ncbi:MAG: immunoglobulin domain-containing protein, partial [Planctomycetota bacterium]|nr:immunoglobulin domain-containing protein [Planctomycetota bacterium]
QWRWNGVDLADGGNLSGATSAALTLANVQTNDTGSYQVAITNSEGSATSALASLTVTSPLQPVSQSAGAVVLVNSHSANYLDFQHFIQPYLDNFGFPYSVQDIATNVPGPGISNCAVIIIGHSQLDTNRSYLNSTAQAAISQAVSNGTGLVSFDSDLSAGTTPRYQFVQDIFGFGYAASATSGSSVSLPPTEPLSQMHYITARHPANDSVALRSSISLPGLTLASNATAVALSGGRPFVAAARYGQGHAVQWTSYAWMPAAVLGPLEGLDDLVWRGVVWSARKPFVMRGLPNLVVLRMDDVSGPFWWVHAANQMGFKPWLGLFLSNVAEANTTDLRGLVTNGNATASVHSWDCCNTFFYFNHNVGPWPDNVMSDNYYAATQWHNSHGIPVSRFVTPHYAEMGPNAFAGLKAWGVEFFGTTVVPGTEPYLSPPAPWLIGGPYRLYETTQAATVNWPVWYADFLSVPGHPRLTTMWLAPLAGAPDRSSAGWTVW